MILKPLASSAFAALALVPVAPVAAQQQRPPVEPGQRVQVTTPLLRGAISTGTAIRWHTDSAIALRARLMLGTGRDTPRVPRTVWGEQGGQSEGSVGGAIGAGVGLGLLGWVAGALVGYAIVSDCTGELCGLEGIFFGGAAGGTTGLALGVHLGNGRRGNFALDWLAAAAVWGAGIGLALAAEDEGAVAVLAAIPIAQLGVTVAVERATGRSRARRREARLFVVPQRDGRFALAASVSF